MIMAGCVNMNPSVKYDPKVDAEAYCAIGEKDSKIASRFWDKVENGYIDKGLGKELEVFEQIITERSQTASQELPVRIAKRNMQVREGEVSFCPEQDAQTYLDLNVTDQSGAEEFYKQVVESYNTDGMYEDLKTFQELCQAN